MADKFEIKQNDKIISISGAVYIHNIRKISEKLKSISSKNKIIELAGITKLDTAGALLLSSLNAKLKNLPNEYKSLFELVTNAKAEVVEPVEQDSKYIQLINHIGKSSIELVYDTRDIIRFLGQSIIALIASITQPHKMRWGSIIHQIEAIGIGAIPIVSVMAFAISIILAYQGVSQLKPLGAEQFTVNLITVSVLREMGVLLTAIMIAGRSGSAFTAEIGVMKLREEVDALSATGLDPFQMLVVPRLIAIIIALPLLTFIADIMGLLGGAVMSSILMDTSFQEYMDQIQRIATLKMFFVGLVKAPVFALMIGIVGCMHGMRVSGSSESVGRETTASVVKSIFLVLILDALFSILFQQMGV